MAVGSGSGRGTRRGANLLVVLIAAFACKREEGGAGGPSAAGGSTAAAPAKGGTPDEGSAQGRHGRFVEEKWGGARRPRVGREEPGRDGQDLANLACVKLHRFPDDPAKAQARVAEAKGLCQKAVEKDAACAAAHYVLGLIAFDKELVPADALKEFALAVKLAPDDVPARMRWSEALDETGDLKGAIEQLEFVKARGIEYAGSYMAVYRLSA
jgi:hypothetical protein